ncbi:class II aldolase/adducin N-terminal [Morchella snyderi]|nr:class II aldolase/adducin N-terminal [Morchella snyderi]
MPPSSVSAVDAADLPTRTGLRPDDLTYTDNAQECQILKERLAAAFRLFAKYGFDEGVAGHISLRDPVDKDTFWVNPLGLHFSLIKASDLIQVDAKGKVIAGGANRRLNQAAFAIHSAIHEARPDVACACHSHSIYGRTFSTLGRELDMITQDSCSFYNDHVIYRNFKGVVLDEEEGMNIAEALGDKKVALLQNHGILSTGKTIEEAVFWFVSMEKCCHTQLMADAACAGRGGSPIKIADEEAATTHKVMGSIMYGRMSGLALFDMIENETGGQYKL